MCISKMCLNATKTKGSLSLLVMLTLLYYG
jgi:hypothetical protein